MSVNFDLNTLRVNNKKDTLNIPKDDQIIIRGAFNRFISDPNLFYVSRITDWDGVAIAIVVLALGALAYLISANKFFNYPGLSYSLIGVSVLGLAKVIYRQYCVSKAKEHLYIGFAITSCRPYINTIEGNRDIERYRSQGRPLDIKDLNDAMDYLGGELGMWDKLFDTKEFIKVCFGIRSQISVTKDLTE